MIALILNSGIGRRMGALTENTPKCMIEIEKGVTILDRQLKLLLDSGIRSFVITTGPHSEKIESFCRSKYPSADFIFVNNPQYMETNYIYSIMLTKDLLIDDLLLIHGDLVFDRSVLDNIVRSKGSHALTSDQANGNKDFKAVLQNGKIHRIGVDIDGVPLLPMYKISKHDWRIWMSAIEDFCADGKLTCYAEDAFNSVSNDCDMRPMNIGDAFCMEMDNLEDLRTIKEYLGSG